MKNVYMYHKEEIDENVNMKQKVRLITSKTILKWPNLETINETENEKADVNLKKGLNPY